MSEKKRILLIENEYDPAAKPIMEILTNEGYEVIHVCCVADAQQKLKEEDFDAVILDLGLPPDNKTNVEKIEVGLSLLKYISVMYSWLPTIIITKHLDPSWRDDLVFKFGAYEFINKKHGIVDEDVLRNIIIELKKIEKYTNMWKDLYLSIYQQYLKWITTPSPSTKEPWRRREMTLALQDLRNKILDRSQSEVIRILDAGCGEGAFLSMMALWANSLDNENELGILEYYGIDKSEKNISNIEYKYKHILDRFNNYSLNVATINNINYKNNFFDYIFCILTLHEISPLKLCDSLFKLISVLKVGGKMDIIDVEEVPEGEELPTPWKSEAIIDILKTLVNEKCDINPLRYGKEHGPRVPLYSIIVRKKENIILSEKNLKEAEEKCYAHLRERRSEILSEIRNIEIQIKNQIDQARNSIYKCNFKRIIELANKLFQLKSIDYWIDYWEHQRVSGDES